MGNQLSCICIKKSKSTLHPDQHTAQANIESSVDRYQPSTSANNAEGDSVDMPGLPKEEGSSGEPNKNGSSQTNSTRITVTKRPAPPNVAPPVENTRQRSRSREPDRHHDVNNVIYLQKFSVKDLIIDTLKMIRTLVDSEQEPPRSLFLLHKYADKDRGWVEVVTTMIDVIPESDALGPAVITLLLEECPLPTKESINDLCKILDLSSSKPSKKDPIKQRNICIALGCLAEKMAGPSSLWLLSEDVISYLFSNLSSNKGSLSTKLFSVVALEKFAQTTENKLKIMDMLEKNNVLESLEKFCNDNEDFVKREVGFCAQWCLDNIFVPKNRQFSYEVTDLTKINVMLNSHDVSEYLKLAPNGLEARCDATSFESVRCTFQVCDGVWYYEVLIVTAGVMQIGWATKDSKFLNQEGYGIGDDEHSIAYDGCRQLIWYNAKSSKHEHDCWKSGDILGLLLDIDKKQVVFSLNGQCLAPSDLLFKHSMSGFFAAASFMSFQQCRFNFGSEPFRYAPKVNFRNFNESGHLSDEEKVILPRQKKLALLRQIQVTEDSCTLCADNKASVHLMPCNHRGFCMTCAVQLDNCPMCRVKITDRILDS